MKKLLAVVASLVAVGFAAGAADAAVTMNTTIHSEFSFADPCTNESVFVSGSSSRNAAIARQLRASSGSLPSSSNNRIDCSS